MRRRSSVLLVFALLASLLPGLAISAAAQPADGDVFISEFHYDNAGTDTGEFVEVTTPAGTDASELSIVLYNGNNGAAYSTRSLEGVVEDEGPGYGTVVLDYASNGIQNGSPDGIALVENGELLEFLSYEGTFTAIGGPADGVESTDVGVEQTGSEPTTASIERVGSVPDTWEWVSNDTNSKGELNPDLTFATTVVGEPFINEFHYDNDGTDEGEFIEVALPEGTDLTGWSIVRYNGSNGQPYGTDTLGELVPTGAESGWEFVTVTYPSNGLQNGAPDGFALVDDAGATVQFLSYEGTFEAVGGPADGLTSTDVGVAQTGAATLDPVGASLQLAGEGSSYEDFTWERTQLNTAGAINADQTLIPPSGEPSNAEIRTDCDDITYDEGQTGSADISARDRDGTVVSADLTAEDGITLSDVDPATEVGGTLTATVDADDSLAVGTYTATVEFANDDESPQTATCEITVNVQGDPCDDPTLINDINTVGDDGLPAVTMNGERVGVEAVVTADFQDGLNGFYVQEEDADADGDESTSEGIFVYTPAADEAPEVGTLVCAVGTVAMFSGSAQLTNVRVEVLEEDQPLPAAVQLKMPVGDLVEISRIAGMRTELTGEDGTMTIAQNYFQGQFGELDLSATGRLWNPTELYRPDDPEAAALREQNVLSLIKLDDANSSQNREPIPWLANGALRAGAETDDVIEGIASYQFGAFRIQPTAPDDITFTNEDNPRPDGPPDVLADAPTGTDNLVVASFNVLNYFTTLTSESSQARGADTEEEFELQAAKIVTAITKMDADVIGLMEIENNFGADGDALADLVERLNAEAGEGTYAAIALDAPVGTDAISNAMIYQPASVTPVGDPAIADHEAFVNPLDANIDRNRPAIAQAFETASGEVFIAVVNHLKSKGSSCGAADPGTDLEGNCNLTRTMAVEELLRWLEEDDPTGTGSDQIAIIGDLNAYAMEDPIQVLRDAGYVDAEADSLGETYSYVFDGELGRLDHAFLSPALADNLVDAATWNINADEPNAFDYNDWNDPATQDESEFRSSDHDPVLVGLAFGEPSEENWPPTVEDLELTTEEGTPVDGQVVAEDPDGDELTYTFATPDHGTLTPGADGAFTYTPDAGFTGTDTFTVTVTDADGGEAVGTITVTVTEREEPPAGPTSKDACKRGGWQRFEDPGFRNQGQCVASVVADDGSSAGDHRTMR